MVKDKKIVKKIAREIGILIHYNALSVRYGTQSPLVLRSNWGSIFTKKDI